MTKNALATIVLSSLIVLSGCGAQPEFTDEPQAFPEAGTPQGLPEPAPLPPSANEFSTSGELADVNPDEGTFSLVADDGARQTFRFEDSTAVLGGDGTQGLAAQEGARITVYYNFDTTPPTAVRIEIDSDSDPLLPSGL